MCLPRRALAGHRLERNGSRASAGHRVERDGRQPVRVLPPVRHLFALSVPYMGRRIWFPFTDKCRRGGYIRY